MIDHGTAFVIFNSALLCGGLVLCATLVLAAMWVICAVRRAATRRLRGFVFAGVAFVVVAFVVMCVAAGLSRPEYPPIPLLGS